MNIPKKVVLLTGATGFVGTRLCENLLEEGFRVRAFVRPTSGKKLLKHKDLEIFLGDLLSCEDLKKACDGASIVVHLAGTAHVNNISDEEIQKTIVLGTRLLLSAAVKEKVHKLVYISSSLAGTIDGLSTVYGRSKLEAENLISSEQMKDKIDSVILRPVNLYGEGMRGNMALFISLISRGLVLRLPKLENKISLLGVNDFSRAIILAIKSGNSSGRIFAVTDGQCYGINEIEESVYHATGRKLPRWSAPRVVIYSAILVISLLVRLMRLIQFSTHNSRGLSMRTYRNLVSENLVESTEISNELGFKPKSTFYSELPKIIKALDH